MEKISYNWPMIRLSPVTIGAASIPLSLLLIAAGAGVIFLTPLYDNLGPEMFAGLTALRQWGTLIFGLSFLANVYALVIAVRQTGLHQRRLAITVCTVAAIASAVIPVLLAVGFLTAA